MVIREDVQRVLGQPSPTLQELLDGEQVPVPTALRSRSIAQLGTEDISRDRYFSHHFHEVEVERLWKRVWQLVCREDEIPNVGDTYVYDIAELSVLVVRSVEDEIKAYPNACLHRGRQLRSSGGKATELRCSFHGFCWSLDGTLKDIPCPWDFGHIAREEFNLPEFRVATCHGFVFISMDPDAPSLDDYLGGLVDHLDDIARPPLGDRFLAAHVIKPVRANWKVGIEAFIESMHLPTTHPQLQLLSAEACAQVDVYPGERHWSRVITPVGVPSPSLGRDVDPQDVADSMIVDFLGADPIEVPPGDTARKTIASGLPRLLGLNVDGLTQSQILDSIAYFVFPNVLVTPMVIGSMAISFRPVGGSPDESLMELRLLAPLPEGTPCPPACEPQRLGVDETLMDTVVELGQYGVIIDQDLSNMPFVQRGLRASTKAGVTPSKYLEGAIRNMHRVLDEYVLADGNGRVR